MRIGIPKEVKKNNENRVAMTPAGVIHLVGGGHEVYIETEAGIGSGFTDKEYEKKAGAVIVRTAQEAWSMDMVMKVKEPIQSEYIYFSGRINFYLPICILQRSSS
ncbi:hypothetical protein GCM10020331_031910 [Ectobacillus funiculus]